MLNTVKDYAYSVYVISFFFFLFRFMNILLIYNLNRKEKVKETVVTYTSRSEVDKILIEATANENWNVANSKL